ncbi:hypothetical protein V6N13_076957 [Hibiscus sabdariffa]
MDDFSHSDHSSSVSRSSSSDNKREFFASAWSVRDSSNLLEAAEKMIEELHAKSKVVEEECRGVVEEQGKICDNKDFISFHFLAGDPNPPRFEPELYSKEKSPNNPFKTMIEVEPPSPLRYIIGAAVMLIGVVLPVGYMMFRNKRVPSSSSYSKQTNKVLI